MENGFLLELHADQPLVLEPGRYSSLKAVQGTIWMTAYDCGDVFLRYGESCPLPKSGKIIIEAVFGAAQIKLVPVAPSGQRRLFRLFHQLVAFGTCYLHARKRRAATCLAVARAS